MSATSPSEQLPIYTSDTFELPGLKFERHIGLCWGLTVITIGIVKGFVGGLKTIRAGEVPEYTQVLDNARRVALNRMIEHAQTLGGNAVVGIRFDSNTFGENDGSIEALAYGTAIVVTVP